MKYWNATFLCMLYFSLVSCNHLFINNESESKQIVASNNVVQLNIVGHWLGEGKREKLVKEFVNEFEFVNQDIHVNMKFPEELYKSENEEIDFIIDQVTKTKPDFDIIRLKSDYPVIARAMKDENWGSKYLVDFTSVPGFIEKHIPSLDIVAIKRRTGNICVSPCLEGNYETMYVNVDLSKKIGISVKQYGMTYEDLLGYLKTLDQFNKQNKTSIIPIFENADDGWLTTEPIFDRLFFSLMDGFSEINQIKYSEKKIRALEQTYKAYEELSKYNPLQKNKIRKGINWGRDNDYPLKDSCLFFVNGSYMYNIWDAKNPSALTKMMPCELPVFKPSDCYLGDYSSNWCVPKNAPHRAEAIKLMMYLCQPSMAEKWVRYTKCPSGIKGNLTVSAFGVDAFEDFQFTINKKYGTNLVAKGDFKIITGEMNNIRLNSTKVLGGEISANEAIRNLRKNLRL